MKVWFLTFSFLTLLHPSAHGILGGKRTSSLPYAIKDAVISVNSLGTGFVVEGCVVTAAHVAIFGGELYSGDDINSKDYKKLSDAEEIRYFSRYLPTNPLSEDLAVIKPKIPLDPKMSLGFSVLSAEPISILRKKNNEVIAIGFGASHIREKLVFENSQKIGKFEYDQFGVRRYGEMVLGKETDDTGLFSLVRGKKLYLVTPGDSGGPIFGDEGKNGIKIYGLTTAIDDANPQNHSEGFAIDLERKRDWLRKTLDELKCSTRANIKLVKEPPQPKKGAEYESVRAYLQKFDEFKNSPQNVDEWILAYRNWLKNQPKEIGTLESLLLALKKGDPNFQNLQSFSFVPKGEPNIYGFTCTGVGIHGTRYQFFTQVFGDK